MNFIKNITTVVLLFVLAYGLYANWSLREISAFIMLGFAVNVLLETIFPEPENE